MTTWRDRAACLGKDTELFFPPSDENEYRDESRAAKVAAAPAKAICATCPVISDCLNWAVESEQRFGIFGGTTTRERHLLRRGLARAS